MPARNKSWVTEIINRKKHTLLHLTSRECALSILKQRRIHGKPLGFLEDFAHFTYKGWPTKTNILPNNGEVTLLFTTDLPARYRGQGNMFPEKGFLEIYSLVGNNSPWQCCIHPDSEPLTFCGITNWEPNLSWSDRIPFCKSLDKNLFDESRRAFKERRKIRASLPDD